MTLINTNADFWPQYILLELTTRCNLSCIMCSANDDTRLQKGGEWYGDLDTRVLSNLEPSFKNVARIDLNGAGESLLSPLFVELLTKIKGKNRKAFVGLTTNALLLNKNIAEQIVQEGLDELIVSIHASEPDLYGEISRYGSFDKLMDNISVLNSYKTNYRTNLPVLKINFVAMKKNIHQLKDLLYLAKKMNVGEVAILQLAEYSLVRGESLSQYPDLVRTFFPDVINCAEKLGLILHIPDVYLSMLQKQYYDPAVSVRPASSRVTLCDSLPDDPIVRNCTDPWDFMYILQSGRVRPCCVLDEYMGDLTEQTFGEMWHGDKYEQLRRDILSNQPPSGCVTCILRPLTRLSHLKDRVSAIKTDRR